MYNEVDTNIVIDFLAKRSEFLPAVNLMQMAIEGKLVLFIITRVPKHFRYATIPVMNASEYLAQANE